MIRQLETRFRPSEGWLPFVLLVAVIGCATTAVLEIELIPQDRFVTWVAWLGLAMGIGLAKRPLSPLIAWLFISVYGIVLSLVQVGNLWPPLALLFDGWRPLRAFWLGNGALFFDRTASWFKAVTVGNASQETVVFALALAWLTWLLSAYDEAIFSPQRLTF
jgi:hypothetical protein